MDKAIETMTDDEKWAFCKDVVISAVVPKWTERDKALFIAYAKDAGNWSGNPLVGGNVGGSKEDRGNLTHLKKLGLVKTWTDEGNIWLAFTEEGRRVARELLGINIC